VEQLADLRQRPGRGELGAAFAGLMAALHDLGATELSAAYAARTLSPVEVVRAVIAHVERWEPHLKALYAFDPEGALAQARAAESRWQRGASAGALDGVPVTIKENTATKGVPVPAGTAATELMPAAEDAPPSARLREAGCVVLAKTTMPDYGMLSSGLSSFHPLTRNPWNLGKNPGGSSAGAGAAAAAGYGPLHLGTDIGGSIRLPAGWCGVFGLKPSLGRVPIRPPYAGRVAGPMTRTVADAALMMAELSKPDWRDTMGLPYQAQDWSALDLEVEGLRLGLLMDAGWGLPVEPATRAAVEAAARAFEAAGAVVVPMRPFMTREMIDGMDHFWRMRSWLDITALPQARRDQVLPYIRAWAEGAAALTGAQVFHGYSQMGAMREAAVAACHPFDFVLSPVSPVPTYPAEWASPLNDPLRPFEHIAFTLPYNMSEQPAASVPCGFTPDGLPIGLQIVGQRHDDLGVLRLARAWERLRPALRPWPAPPA
jgi:aspartyl-tRNA(Asn)/glutamyl-tRNA(Gln) amidotransferase subunit A